MMRCRDETKDEPSIKWRRTTNCAMPLNALYGILEADEQMRCTPRDYSVIDGGEDGGARVGT